MNQSAQPSHPAPAPPSLAPPLAAPERLRLDEQIAGTIADAIIDGHYPPGSLLPPERELAEQLGVNRTSLRQALARLEQMGLIEARQGSGNVVRDPAGLVDPAVVEALVRRLGPDFLAELFDIRQALGPLIGRLAAERAEPGDVEALRGALAAVESAGTAADRQAADLLFFAVLVHATHHRAMSLLFRWVETVYGGRAGELSGAFGDPGGVAAGLRAITGAVAARDAAGAAAAVERYLRESGARMLDVFAADGAAGGDRGM